MDFRETFRELWVGLVYLWRRMRGAETDPHARRVAMLENAFDKSREQVWRERREEEKERGLQVAKAVEVDVDGERQWLGAGGDDYDYGLSRRERNEAPGVEVERELEKRDYGRSGGECETFDDVFELLKLNDLIGRSGAGYGSWPPEPHARAQTTILVAQRVRASLPK